MEKKQDILIASELICIAKTLTADYYRPTSSIKLDEIADRWADSSDKIYDSALPLAFSVRDLWPHREYTWSREKSRRSAEEWDELSADMKKRGWDKDEPLHLFVGKDGNMKVGEGNHRLAIAKELRLSRIPVWIHFWQSVRK